MSELSKIADATRQGLGDPRAVVLKQIIERARHSAFAIHTGKNYAPARHKTQPSNPPEYGRTKDGEWYQKKRLLELENGLAVALIAKHLAGEARLGVYFHEPDATTIRVAVLDFDDKSGEVGDGVWEKTAKVAASLREAGMNPVAERSGGGKGTHLWLLWDEPQEGKDVRAMLQSVLEEHGLREGTKGLSEGTVEIFPKQDYLRLVVAKDADGTPRPTGAYGNLCALPFNRQSALLDDDGNPIEIQHGYQMPISPAVPTIVSALDPSNVPAAILEHAAAVNDDLSHGIGGEKSHSPPTLQRVQDAMPWLDADDTHLWQATVQWLKRLGDLLGDDEMKALWLEFSARGTNTARNDQPRYDPEVMWDTATPRVDAGAAAGSLFKVTREAALAAMKSDSGAKAWSKDGRAAYIYLLAHHTKVLEEEYAGGAYPSDKGLKNAAKEMKDNAEPSGADVVSQQAWELFIDQYGNPRIWMDTGKRFDALIISSDAFVRHWNYARIQQGEKALSEAKMGQLQQELEARAEVEGGEHTVHLRTALDNGDYVLDLGDDDGHCVRVNANGVTVEKNTRVKFIRPRGFGTLPMPDLSFPTPRDAFLECRNMNAMLLLKTNDAFWMWLVAMLNTLMCDTPYNHINFWGESGVAKSSGMALSRSLIDPRKTRHQAGSTRLDKEAINAAAAGQRMPCFDNVKKIETSVQAYMCAAITGTEAQERALYTNFELAASEVHCPLTTTSIHPLATEPDLIERTVSLPCAKPKAYISPKVIARKLEQQTPRFTGALLVMLKEAMGRWDDVPDALINRQRFLDFVRLGEALFMAMGRKSGAFLEVYNRQRRDNTADLLAGRATSKRVIKYLRQEAEKLKGRRLGKEDPAKRAEAARAHRSYCYDNGDGTVVWCGTASVFYNLFTKVEPITMDEAKHDAFPSSPHWLGRVLSTDSPALRHIGIHFTGGKRTKWGSQMEFAVEIETLVAGSSWLDEELGFKEVPTPRQTTDADVAADALVKRLRDGGMSDKEIVAVMRSAAANANATK